MTQPNPTPEFRLQKSVKIDGYKSKVWVTGILKETGEYIAVVEKSDSPSLTRGDLVYIEEGEVNSTFNKVMQYIGEDLDGDEKAEILMFLLNQM